MGKTLEGTDAKIHAAYTRFEILEGPENVKGAIIIEFPTYEIAKTWYESPEYTRLRGTRIRNHYTGILIDGGYVPVMDRFPEVQ